MPLRGPLGCALLCLGSCGGSQAPGGVLLISIDSLRADHLGCYGYESATAPEQRTSPRIDALAAEGIWMP